MNAPVGYRLNRAIPGGRLESIWSPYLWRSGMNHASCLKGHRAPDRKCGCGFYLYGTPLLAAKLALPYAMARENDRLVVSEAAAFGRVFEMDDGQPQQGNWGFRAEYVQLRAIIDIGIGRNLMPWARNYDVPVVLVDDDVALIVEGPLAQFGLPVETPDHVGAQIGGQTVNVPMYSRVRFELWEVPLGTRIRVVRDLADDARPVVAWRRV